MTSLPPLILSSGRVKQSAFCMSCNLREVLIGSQTSKGPFTPGVITSKLTSVYYSIIEPMIQMLIGTYSDCETYAQR